MEDKTMVMKILDSKRIKYQFYKYNATSETTGVEVANILKQNYNQVFKTLVTVGKSNKNYVFVIPVDKELDLKKCASITNEKYIEMIKSKDLLNTTGYVHGGCSPIGMKKFFPTFIDETIKQFESIIHIKNSEKKKCLRIRQIRVKFLIQYLPVLRQIT